MLKLFERSLLLRLGIAMASITALALIGMGSSVVIAEMMRGEAAAINQAGSLRMQSYWIATRMLSKDTAKDYEHGVSSAIRQFDDRLRSPRLVDALPMHPRSDLRKKYDHVAASWQNNIRPVLVAYLEQVTEPHSEDELNATRMHILRQVDDFVVDIDRLVKLLEEDAESKINLLRLIQGFSLFLTFGVAYVTMYLTYRDVLTPLKDLLAFAERARRGDFSLRPEHTGEDELGRLGRAFKVMAEDLSKTYADLESRVAEKTADLERSNRSLELLYETTNRLNEAAISPPVYTELLREIEKVLGLGPGWICLVDEAGSEPTRLAATVDAAGYCDRSHCDVCKRSEAPRLRTIDSGGRLLSVPLRDRERNHGVLMLRIPLGVELESWQVQLVEAIGHHIGIAIGTALRTAQGRRLALFEERQAIARELHDSLAQSLSYLKIQLGRLRSVLGPQAEGGAAQSVLHEMREGVNDAYRQLRELLTTFRLKMDGRGLSAALADTVAEFGLRGDVPITLDNQLQGCQLSVNEEIHVLQIVREALSNVLRHAHAKQASVRLERVLNDGVGVTIDDDGVGFGPMARRRHHYGLAIMQERARSLGGEITVQAGPRGVGTRVVLRFTPAGERPSLTSSAASNQ